MEQYAARWLKRNHDVSPETIKKYQDELSYALAHIGKLKLQSVRAPLLKELVVTLADRRMKHGRPMSPRTLHKIVTRLRALFREAVGDQVIYASPMEGVKSPRIEVNKTAEVKALDFEQEARLIAIGSALYEAGMARFWPALFLLLRMGLRRGEAMGLTWADIDLEAGMLKIRQARIKAIKGTRTGSPKTSGSRRTLPMPEDVIAMLRGHRDVQRAERTAASASWQEHDIVFATLNGEWEHPDNLNRALTTLLTWSDARRTDQKRWRGVDLSARPALLAAVQGGPALPGISPHDLRHTYATLTIRRGVPVEIVSRYLGHATVVITLSIYRHVLPEELQLAAIERTPLPQPTAVGPERILN